VKYDRWLEEGERIINVTTAILPVTAPPFAVTNVVIGPDGDRFAYFTSGGVDGEDYVVTITITTNVDQVREDELLFGVREVRRG
jgi:hypothetical protein